MFLLGCDSSPTASKSDLLYAEMSKICYSINDTITLDIYNSTEDSVYFKYYDDIFIIICEKISTDNVKHFYSVKIPRGAVLNPRALKPNSIKQYKRTANWTGEFIFRIPFNYNGSTEFQDTLISNIFTVE